MNRKQAEFVPALAYHWLTRLYDPVVRWTLREAHLRELFTRQGSLVAGQTCLDLGCGTGSQTIVLKQRCPEANVTGIDADARVLDLARQKAEQAGVSVVLDQGTVTALPYADGSFDRVFSCLLFHHLSDGDKLLGLREACRVLRGGGELHLADWGAPAGPLLACAFLGVRILDGFAVTRAHAAGELPQIVSAAGFREVSITARVNTLFGTIDLLRAGRPG